MKRKFIVMITLLILSISIVSCKTTDSATDSGDKTQVNMKSVEDEEIGNIDTYIELGESININGDGAKVDNNKVNITQAGTYSISGTLKDGQIIINVGDNDKVYLILNNVNISCSNSSPIYVSNAKKAIVALADGTENVVEDGSSYVFEDKSTDEPNAAIFSKDDLTFIGKGSLVVKANYNNGITSKDDLRIQSGNISVTSANDGFKGKDSLTIKEGNITINSKGDGIQANNDTDASKGYVWIEDGTFNIVSGEDGIQAETDLLISSGEFNITTGGGNVNGKSVNKQVGNIGMPDKGGMKPEDGQEPSEMEKKFPDGAQEPPEMPSEDMNKEKGNGKSQPQDTDTQANAEEETVSAKAIKAGANVTIDGGTLKIDSSDDSIHTNNSIVINNGVINITSGDDGIHADSTLDINGGEINITKSYEGLESEIIIINGGSIKVKASDDGINAAGGNDGSSVNGRPGQNNFASSGDAKIEINGGNIVVDTAGDGIDANGSIYMKDGQVIVNGPSDNGNGALDYDGECEIIGGTLIAAGSSGMVQVPSESSSQKSVSITLTSQMTNSIIRVESESGENIITFMPSKQYQTVVINSPKLKEGETYNVFTGGTLEGEAINGLYSEGTYSGGTKLDSFNISSTVTYVGKSGMNGGGHMGAPGGKGNRGEKIQKN